MLGRALLTHQTVRKAREISVTSGRQMVDTWEVEPNEVLSCDVSQGLEAKAFARLHASIGHPLIIMPWMGRCISMSNVSPFDHEAVLVPKV